MSSSRCFALICLLVPSRCLHVLHPGQGQDTFAAEGCDSPESRLSSSSESEDWESALSGPDTLSSSSGPVASDAHRLSSFSSRDRWGEVGNDPAGVYQRTAPAPERHVLDDLKLPSTLNSQSGNAETDAITHHRSKLKFSKTTGNPNVIEGHQAKIYLELEDI